MRKRERGGATAMVRRCAGGAALGRLSEGGREEGGKGAHGLVGWLGLLCWIGPLGQMGAGPVERKEKK
jgi:hypothetical protein